MSSNLGVGKTLELLDRLRGTVRDFATRAEKLNAEHNTRIGRERRLRDAAAEKQAKALAAAISDAEAAYASAREAATARHAGRRARIEQACLASKEKKLAAIESQTGTRKYELQRTMLQAERDRDAGLGDAATALEELRANLGAEQASLTPLETAARGAFAGYRKFVRALSKAYQNAAAPDPARDANQLLVELRDLLGKARGDLERFRKFWLLRVFKYLALWVVIVLGEVGLVLQHFGLNSDAYWKAGICAGGSLVVVLVLRYLAGRQSGVLAASIATTLGRARLLHDTCSERAESHYQQELERIKSEYESTTRTVDQRLKLVVAEAGDLRVGWRMEIDDKASRALGRNDRLHRVKRDRLQQQHSAELEHLKRMAEIRQKAEVEASHKREAQFNADYQADWQKLEAEWKSAIEPICESIKSAERAGGRALPALGCRPAGGLGSVGGIRGGGQVRPDGR